LEGCISIYNYSDYKDYIRHQVDVNKGVRGYQTLLAKAAGCARPYLSQVLNGGSHLSMEQLLGISELWKLKEDEIEFFMTLLQMSRAGTEKLRSLMKGKANRLKREKENLTSRFKKPGIDSVEAKALYYSSWSWAAVHILLTIPEYRTVESIFSRLQLPHDQVYEILNGLKGIGLIKKYKGEYKLTEMHIHLPKKSPFISIHHSHWRNKAIQDAATNNDASLHYTGVHSLSYEDYEKIKSILLDSIDKCHEVIRPSKEQELVAVNIDLFKV
jgi:uncharacterized protein (TIGR02147 family)